MKKLMASTAIALLAAAPLAAQTTPAPDATAPAAGLIYSGAVDTDAIYGSDLIGMTVYSSATEYDDTTPVGADVQAGWDNIGEVGDVLISPDGQVEAILVNVGGFLGLGEHTVALDMAQVHLLADENGNRFAAVNSTVDELKAAPEFERPAPADNTAMNAGPSVVPPADGMAAAPADNMAAAPADTMPAPADNMAAAPADATPAPADNMAAAPVDAARPVIAREGYVPVDYATLTAEELDGATVYDANDDSIGKISELEVGADGKISQAIVDVGGFLGMGAHSVALSYDELQIMKNADNSDLRVYIDTTKENLEQRPEYQKG